MTKEAFRKWIVILLALVLITMWVSMGLRQCKINKYGDMWREGKMAHHKSMMGKQAERAK